MTYALKLFRDILCRFRFTRGFVHRFFRRWVLFLAFLGRRLGVWRPWSDRVCGTFQKAERAEWSSPGTTTRLESRGSVVAASHIPASASHPSLDNTLSSTSQQLQPATVSSATPAPADLIVEPPSHRVDVDPSSASDARIHSNRGSTDTDSSIQGRSSDRPSITQAHSRESVHWRTPIGQPTQIPRDPLRQSGRGPSTSPSRERPSRSPSPTDRIPQPRLEVDATNLRPQTQVDSRNSPIDPPSATPHAGVQLSPPSVPGFRSRQSSTTSMVAEVENLSTGSLPHRFFTDGSPPTEEPYTIGHLSVDAPDLHEGLPQHNPTASPSSATSNLDPPGGRFLQMINSEQVPRYTKDVTTVPYQRTNYEIPPLTTREFPYSPEQMSPEQGFLKDDCTPWVPAMHPEGALYFFDQDRRLFTDTDMLDPVLREEIEIFYHYLQRILHHDGVVIPSKNYDLVLDVMPSEDQRIRWSYYYACHETRCLFWLDPYDVTHTISELSGVRSPAHVKNRLEALYWYHWSLFPAVFEGRRLDHAVIDELVGMLSHGCMDMITSKSSTLPYDVDTMQKMLASVQNAKGSDAGLVYHTAGVTRVLSFFAHWRFLYSHGTSSAILERHSKSHRGARRRRTLLITSLSPALFFAPEGYLQELENKRLDEAIREGSWENFISGLLKEWEQLVIPSTVMLSANVGFLATPGVVISNLNSNITGAGQVVIYTSPSQIASCMSIVASAGSIMVALLLIRHSNPRRNGELTDEANYLYANTHRVFGLEPMAIIFSLPWALLLCSMVAFFVALLLFCLGTSNASTRIFVAVTSVVVALPIGWCIHWGSSNALEAWFRSVLPPITYTLRGIYTTWRRILALIYFRLHRPSPSSPA